MDKVITYKNFLEEQAYKFGMDWEERREYIRELLNMKHLEKGYLYFNPFRKDK